MSKSLNQLFGKRKQKTKQLWDREFNIVEEGLDEEQVIAFVNSLIEKQDNAQIGPINSIRSLIERTIKDAEQLAASIKKKAREEAREEAARIIDQARLEAGVQEQPPEITNQVETSSQAEPEASIVTTEEKEDSPAIEEQAESEEVQNKTPEDESSVPEETAEDNSEGDDEAQKPENWEAELADGRNALEERAEEYSRLEKESPGSDTDENSRKARQEPPSAEEVSEAHPGNGNLSQLDDNALYTGEVELDISTPVNPVAVAKLYNYLQTTPDMKILYTRGSWDKGTTLTVSLDKPLPFIGLITKVPGIKITPAYSQQDNMAKGTSSSILGVSKKGITRINIHLSEG